MARVVPYALLAGLVLLFFGDLVRHPDQTLYAERSDLLAMHLPNKVFLVRSWQETGEIPLWNPYVFAGMPFAPDMQVAAFYPLYVPLYFLPEKWLGPAMSWLVVLHVMIAGWCAYAHARAYLAVDGPLVERDGVAIGPFVAAVGYAFAAKWLLHLLAGGHFPMLGLAWVPLVLLYLERAIRERSWRAATWAGGAFALIILGSHPQVMFYAGLFVAAWSLGTGLEVAGWWGATKRTWGTALGSWLGFGFITVLVATALAAMQLLPNLAVIPEASRSDGMHGQEGWLVALWKATELIGPPLSEPTWEERGGFTLLWMIFAALGVTFGPKRWRWQVVVLCGLIAFALGGSSLFEDVPGFSYFRLPGRILWFAAIPLALLTGGCVQLLWAGTLEPRRRACLVLLAVVLPTVLLVGLWASALEQMDKPLAFRAIVYWVFALASAGGLYLIMRRGVAAARPWTRWAILPILFLDLALVSWPFVQTRDVATIYEPSACVRYVREHVQPHARVLDRDLPDAPGATPLGFALPMLLELEPVRGWHSLDVHRYKEYVQFILDKDGPFPPTELISNFPIRNKSLLDLLGVQFLMQPATKSSPADGKSSNKENGWEKRMEDEHPRAFGVIRSGGIKEFLPYEVLENDDLLPRAFLVHRAEPLVERSKVLAQLRDTNFREVVLLDEGAPEASAGVMDNQVGAGLPESVAITSYQPNRIDLQVAATRPGYLVLNDVWYPGWRAEVSGKEAPVLRANFTFRAVPIPAGEHEIVFTFDPPSYRWGKILSLVSCLLLAVLFLRAAWLRIRKPSPVA